MNQCFILWDKLRAAKMSPLKKGTSEAEGFLKINLSVSLILKYIYIKVNKKQDYAVFWKLINSSNFQIIKFSNHQIFKSSNSQILNSEFWILNFLPISAFLSVNFFSSLLLSWLLLSNFRNNFKISAWHMLCKLASVFKKHENKKQTY